MVEERRGGLKALLIQTKVQVQPTLAEIGHSIAERKKQFLKYLGPYDLNIHAFPSHVCITRMIPAFRVQDPI